MKLRLFLILGLCLCLFPMGCGKQSDVTKPTVLTHVYTEETFLLPEGYTYDKPVSLDGEFVVQCRRHVQDGDGFVQAVSWWQVNTDGSAPVMLWEKTEEMPLYTVTTDTAAYDLYQKQGDTGYTYDLHKTGADGTVDKVVGLLPLENGNFTGLHVDNDGYVYLFSHNGVQFLASQLQPWGELTGLQISNFVANGNRVVVNCIRGMEQLLVEISAADRDITHTLPQPYQYRCLVMDTAGELYYMTTDGLYRYLVDETGVAVGEMVMSFVNSNLTGVTYTNTAILPDGRVYLEYRSTMDDPMPTLRPVLMCPAPDVDLSDVTVLELYSSDVNAGNHIPAAVVGFNKENLGKACIVWQDYSIYNTVEDPHAGENKLAMELEAGLIAPDIYYGSPSDDVFRLLGRHDNLTDLLSVMASDPVYNGDNLFGCVKNTYTTDGKLVALPEFVEENSALVADGYIAGNSWTVSEMLDIAENLPAGTVMRRMSKLSALNGLLGQGWAGLFVDVENGTCDFDSEDFVRLLTYIDTLPENMIQLNDNAYYLFQQGKLVMTNKSGTDGTGLSAILLDKLYGEGRILAGYPTRNGLSGTVLGTYTNIFAITESCGDIGSAWAFVKNGILNRYTDNTLAYCIPIWKSEFDRAVVLCQEKQYFAAYDGDVMSFDRTIKLAEDGTYRGMAGEIVELTQSDVDAYKAWLDTVGRPISRTVIPTEVNGIITEELDRFYNGAATPADCAKAIQTRVTLWLDENG